MAFRPVSLPCAPNACSTVYLPNLHGAIRRLPSLSSCFLPLFLSVFWKSLPRLPQFVGNDKPSGRGEHDSLLPAQEITGNRFKIDGDTPGMAMPPTAGLRQNADFVKRASDFPAVPRPLPGGFRYARLRSHSTRKATTGRVGCQPVPRPGAWTIYASQAAPFTPAPATSSPYSSRLPLYRSLKNS